MKEREMHQKLKHHEVSAEWVDDEHGSAIMLTQQDGWGDEPQTTIVHPWQLRSICEHFDLLPASGPDAQRQLQTMARRLRRLRDRISDLRDHLANHSDHRHADLTYEMLTVNALADLADEWCEDLAPISEDFGEAFHEAPDAVQASSPQQPDLL